MSSASAASRISGMLRGRAMLIVTLRMSLTPTTAIRRAAVSRSIDAFLPDSPTELSCKYAECAER